MARGQVRLEIDQDRCKGCEICISVCPEGVLALTDRFNPSGYQPVAAVHPEACTGCIRCARLCPEAAFTIWIPAGKAAGALEGVAAS